MRILISARDGRYLLQASEEDVIFGKTLERTERHEEHLLKATLDMPLHVLYVVLQREYPSAKIEISPQISENPWVRSELRWFPDVGPRGAERISKMMQKPTKQCGRCKRQGYWQYSIQAYHCPQCDSVELSTGEWAKMRKSFWMRVHVP